MHAGNRQRKKQDPIRWIDSNLSVSPMCSRLLPHLGSVNIACSDGDPIEWLGNTKSSTLWRWRPSRSFRFISSNNNLASGKMALRRFRVQTENSLIVLSAICRITALFIGYRPKKIRIQGSWIDFNCLRKFTNAASKSALR